MYFCDIISHTQSDNPSAHLDYDSLDAAHVCAGPGRVALNVPSGGTHPDQDGGVGRHNQAAGDDVAGEEEHHGVGARPGLPIGQAPVNATGRAVGLRAIFAPVHQRGWRKQQGVCPGTANQYAAMAWVEPVS